MQNRDKNIAIIGANKETLRLLPVILYDKISRLVMITDPNRDAMLFKLNELGYRLASHLNIRVTTDLAELKGIQNLDTIINALQDPAIERFLEQPEFRDVEKLGPLSARLLWGGMVSVSTDIEDQDAGNRQATLLASLREMVDVVRLTIDRKELLAVVLKLALESIRADSGSIMLLSREEGVLKVEVAKGMDEEVVRKINVSLGEGISGKVAKEGKPLLISGKARSEEFAHLREGSNVKSALCVPLIVNGETIGVLNVNSSESTHAFTDEDLKFLTSLAGLAAEVIQRSNEYERVRADAAKFMFWKEVDSIMSSSVPFNKRLNNVCKKLVEIVPGLTCFIYIYDDDRNRLLLKAASIKDIKALGPLSLGAGEGVEGWGIEGMQDVILVDRTQETGIRRFYLSLPMVVQGRLVGILNCQAVSSQGLSVYRESLLKDIRSLIAESLYKYIQNEKEVLRSRRMFAVDEAGVEMISITDFKKLMNILVTTPAAILGAEGSILRMREGDTKRYQIVASYGLDNKEVRDRFLPLEKEVVLEVLRKGRIVRQEFSEETSPYVRSMLSYPLILNGNIAGVLTLFNKTGEDTIYPCSFPKTDEDILSRFGVYSEKALSNIKKEEGVMSLQSLFKEEVEEEINRARRVGKGFIMATVRITGSKTAMMNGGAEFERNLVDFIKKRIRNFDMVARLDEGIIGVLFPDTDKKVTRAFGGVVEAIGSSESFKKAFMEGKLDIHYGYAIFPEDGNSFAELFSKASHRVDGCLWDQLYKKGYGTP
ncbi:MAG: GAF domain-containing protein [Deltaproteobacteria bacterium]|nr:GAF domain-containing protein [Deltaproteobacteria bacterium]